MVRVRARAEGRRGVPHLPLGLGVEGVEVLDKALLRVRLLRSRARARARGQGSGTGLGVRAGLGARD